MKDSSPPPVRADGGQYDALHSAVTRWTFAATMIGMILYTGIEIFVDRPTDWVNFLLHHFIHVALIGVAVWIASLMVIRRFVIEPVDQIFVHLRRVAAGRLEYLDCTVRAKEVGDVISSVNHLVAKLRRVPQPDAVSSAMDHLRNLREELKNSSEKLGENVVPVMRLVTALEGDLLHILQLTETEPVPSRIK